jgi:hypothetical protein
LLPGGRQFCALYLADTPITALHEVGAMLGTPFRPGGSLPHPAASYLVISVRVDLKNVVCLEDGASCDELVTTAQELTGDWDGYFHRQTSKVPYLTQPTGIAPTQHLGEVLFNTLVTTQARTVRVDGFTSISAKVPNSRTLVVFPENMKVSGSQAEWFNPITGRTERVPGEQTER